MLPSEPITSDTELFVVACAGCRRQLGISRDRHAARSRICCCELCLVEMPVIANEEPAMRWHVASTYGMSTPAIAKLGGKPHAYLYRVLARLKTPVTAQLGWLRPPVDPPTGTSHAPGAA